MLAYFPAASQRSSWMMALVVDDETLPVCGGRVLNAPDANCRLALLYGARAVQDARAVMQDADVPLSIGRSSYIDPFLVSTLLSIKLPLFLV
jgi:hypothetical protein